MHTPPPRRAWGTRFDTLVDSPSVLSASQNADLDMSAEKERSGNYARVCSHSSPSGATPNIDGSPIHARMPHDASVFVASLPAHVPEQELQAHLSTHFSQHATIKHIKLIRDNRGAVCAFVQVESPAQVASLISACNLTLFMDRHIRCEVARAFRTLLVGWRSPRAVTGDTNHEPTSGKAVRLRRCRGSRYIQVSHGADALQTDFSQLQNYSPPRTEDPLSGLGVFFPSGIVEGDYEALKSLLEAFGPLEFITPFECEPLSVDHNGVMFAREGQTVRQAGDDESPTRDVQRPPMWAAKWEHRNDAVSAITALQHVPGLFICWSHTYGRPYHHSYTPYTVPQSHGSSGAHTPSFPPTPYSAESHSHANEEIVTGIHNAPWAVTGPRLQQLHAQALAVDDMKPPAPIAFSESDFPPLRVEADHTPGGGGRGRGRRGVWAGRKNFVRAGAPSPPPISTAIPFMSRLCNGTNTETTASGGPRTPDLDSMIEPSPVTPGFPITPRMPAGGYAPGDESVKDSAYVSPSYQSLPPRHNEGGMEGCDVFVGGLDATTWDEERVQNVFGRFGALEEVRFVRPGFHAPHFKRAFAFLRYTDPKASQRAIAEEHLRIYDDRSIKVQLRDANVRRWAYRGRGRFQHGLVRGDQASLEFDHDVSTTKETEHAPEATGHVRFASVSDADMNIERQPDQGDIQTGTADGLEDAAESVRNVKAEESEDVIYGPKANMVPSFAGSRDSDGAPDASMEAQPRSADTTVTLADMTVIPGHEYVQQEQSDPDVVTAISSTPPPSNDISSTYAPSSDGSAPTSTGYYPPAPSWMPPYAMHPAQYAPYGYYPQLVPGQSSTDASATYPWATTLYRNVIPFVPWFNPPPGVELAAPPVRPTGYIQRDPGGIFIPVYPPERLGQYMSATGEAIDQSQSQTPAQTNLNPSGNWQNFVSHPQLYPVPFPLQPPMIMQQQQTAVAQQQQHPMAGNGWITGPPPGTGYHSQQAASSFAPTGYPAPNQYFPLQSSMTPSPFRNNMYGTHDPAVQHPQKNPVRRSSDYGPHQHRFGGRDGRNFPQRRSLGGPGVNVGEASFGAGTVEPQFAYGVKPNSALPAQLGVAAPGNNNSEWNWNSQTR